MTETDSLESTITCPNCAYQKVETMPTDSCVFFYECTACKDLLKPIKGDCCVFCSFGSRSCPSKVAQNCCGIEVENGIGSQASS